MTFLVFLISLFVLDRIVRRQESRDVSPPESLSDAAKRKRSAESPAEAGGLAALGSALDQYGRGQPPGTTEEPQQSSLPASAAVPPRRLPQNGDSGEPDRQQ
jgi:hypothetical protein